MSAKKRVDRADDKAFEEKCRRYVKDHFAHLTALTDPEEKKRRQRDAKEFKRAVVKLAAENRVLRRALTDLAHYSFDDPDAAAFARRVLAELDGSPPA